jgi:hypothetical protein
VSPRPQADGAALERPPLVLAHAAPHAGVLTGVKGPAQAILDRRAASANLLGFFNLEERRPSVSDREEQLRIYLTTGGNVAPVHDVHSFSASRLVIGPGHHAPLGWLVKLFTSYATCREQILIPDLVVLTLFDIRASG